ncbi:hypothetical protein FGIG_02011 [Fasciola gigantica]|uniref:Cilia- and flagella-associated protein 69 ARM repeats domain-containing protein n=1 Tax=Fasciola gigantica TaxID=46835 RepID=A0A504YUW7_FASGI|nr:hypothetical protein FGIG_02011 [Fasciola gigantica]
MIKELSSDEQTFFPLCVDCLSQLGYLLRINDQLIQRTICHTLDEFYDPLMLPSYDSEGEFIRRGLR